MTGTSKDKHDDLAGPGNGFVDGFSTNGDLLQRLVSEGRLAATGTSMPTTPPPAISRDGS